MNHVATNLVGDYLISSSDLLSSSYLNPPGAEDLTRGYGTQLTSQQTLPSLPGAATTNTDNASSGAGSGSGSGSSHGSGSGGATAYGGGGGAPVQGPALPPGHAEARAGLHYLQTAGMIMAAGDNAADQAFVNAVASAQAPFIICDGNSCVSVFTPGGHWEQWQVNGHVLNGDAATHYFVNDKPGETSYYVQTAAHTQAMPKELADAVTDTIDEATTAISTLPLDIDGDGEPDVTLTNYPDQLNRMTSKGVLYVNMNLEKFPELMDGLRRASDFMSMQSNYYQQAEEAEPEVVPSFMMQDGRPMWAAYAAAGRYRNLGDAAGRYLGEMDADLPSTLEMGAASVGVKMDGASQFAPIQPVRTYREMADMLMTAAYDRSHGIESTGDELILADLSWVVTKALTKALANAVAKNVAANATKQCLNAGAKAAIGRKTIVQRGIIDAQKQLEHIAGSKAHLNRLKSNPDTSAFFNKPYGNWLTKRAFAKGTPVKRTPNLIDYKFPFPVGTGRNGGLQFIVRVSVNPRTGRIHGFPFGPEFLR